MDIYRVEAEKYKETIEIVYNLIDKEISSSEDIEADYPKFIVMYEFFRLLRGEAFLNFRQPVGEYQTELYAMEDRIFERVKAIKAQIPKDSSKAQYNYENLVSQGLRLK